MDIINTFSRERLLELRGRLEDLNVDGFIVPHSDEYQNEFLPSSSERLAWLTSFDGSAGLAVITADKAAIFDLDLCADFEKKMPNTFINMYQFWVQKY